MDPSHLAFQLDQILNQMSDEEGEAFLRDPRIHKIQEATFCESSHDLEHHWPFNIDTQMERPDCIYCDKTKRDVLAAVVNSGRRRGGKVPSKGSFPKRVRVEDVFKVE